MDFQRSRSKAKLVEVTPTQIRNPQSERRKNLQGGELNSRPRAYESPALPLSYPGEMEKPNFLSVDLALESRSTALHTRALRETAR